MRKLIPAFVTSLLAMTSFVVHADHDQADLKALLDELEVNRRLVVEENMNLASGDDDNEKFWSTYDRYRKEIGELSLEGMMLLEEFRQHFEEISDERAQEILRSYLLREQERLDIKQRYIGQFNEVITARQTLRFYQIDNKLDVIIESDVSSVTPLVP